ncbi:MAG: gamma-glutamylcyclotransferase [Rhodobacteraceae bacterium]|nr:gamma-glutamylcyclotransferase [Paracoccaceae bacterium]
MSPGTMVAVFLIALLLALGYAVVRAPFYLPAPAANAPPLPEGDSYVFGFATLTNPVVRLIVVGRPVPAEPAALSGVIRDRRDLRDSPDSVLQGVRFRVTPSELARLDRYERTGRKYRRDLLPLEDGSMAWVYRLIGARGVEALQD